MQIFGTMYAHMDIVLGVIGVISASLAGYTYTIALDPDGSDVQLILGTLYALVSVIALSVMAILRRMDRPKTTIKDSAQ